RDGHVTGVQTCALPISEAADSRAVSRADAPAAPREVDSAAARPSAASRARSLGAMRFMAAILVRGAPEVHGRWLAGHRPSRRRRSEEHTSELQSRGHLV